MDTAAIKAYMNRWLEENKQEFYAVADEIWANPELGLEEYRAFGLITGLLKKYGFQVESGQGGMPTAFVATYGTGRPVIGINAEYDCLPGLSQKCDVSHPDPVQDGAPGQGCGHNLLGTAAAFSAIALRHAIEKFGLGCTVKVLGSPYEEASVGKALIAREGVYNDLDLIMDWHPWNYNRADYDKCNSVFVMKFHFHGKAAHGAYPWEGKSALDAGMLFGMSLEMLREHIKPNGPDAASTINYTFQNCGPLFANVVPDITTVQLYGRFADLETSQDAFERVKNCAQGAALATGTTVEPELITYTHNKIPNKVLAEVVHRNMEHYGSPAFTEEEQNFVKEMQTYMSVEPSGLDTSIQPFGPSETIICDTSEFSWNAPYVTFWVTMGPQGVGWHNWMVTACAGNSIGKKTMDRAAQIMTSSFIDIATSPETVALARAEWKERMAGRTYHCLMPDAHQAPLGINRETMEKYFGKCENNA